MTLKQQAAAMERMMAAIIAAIDKNGGASDVQVIMGSLGLVIGTIAVATGKLDECLDRTMDVARGIIHGQLPNPIPCIRKNE